MIRPDRLKIFHHALIKAVACDSDAIADDDQLAAGAGEGHVQAARDGEKAILAFAVQADEADDHGFFFVPLKTVHAVYFDLFTARAAVHGGDASLSIYHFTQQTDLRCREGGWFCLVGLAAKRPPPSFEHLPKIRHENLGNYPLIEGKKDL